MDEMDQQVLDRKLAKVQQRLSLNAINQDLLVLTRKQTFQDTWEPKTIKIHLKKKQSMESESAQTNADKI